MLLSTSHSWVMKLSRFHHQSENMPIVDKIYTSLRWWTNKSFRKTSSSRSRYLRRPSITSERYWQRLAVPKIFSKTHSWCRKLIKLLDLFKVLPLASRVHFNLRGRTNLNSHSMNSWRFSRHQRRIIRNQRVYQQMIKQRICWST